ncbi:precorrin-6y C5,15-methyltransferase (decarboxylating) subunit CbiE [Dendrosporobacter sp. 1207_IL3150]|uniref:precorrin-6y C5,15-methyltransferase (decarboxylating) subunit CbiE n=1 Tax=Dendrosporobacter sp. 1207_IL3150 TaxID=3084054 RepID=UPI002FDAAAFD
MEYKIVVVGIGPGSPDYLLPIAKRTIDSAKVIVGSKRALDTLATHDCVKKAIQSDIADVLDFIEMKSSTSDVVVLVSGDPGYYSLLSALRGRFSQNQLTVIPGISSFQLAFAKLALPWQDAALVSMHGREPDAEKLEYKPGRKLGILTDSINNPKTIATRLMNIGWPPESLVWICANLSYESEEIISANLTNASLIEGFSHCVMVVKA